MNSRERVKTSLNHKEPDRIPIDIGQSSFTGISAVAYKNLLKYLGKRDREIVIHDRKQQLAKMDEDILEYFGIDVRGIYFDPPANWSFNLHDDDDYTFYSDHWDITWRMPKEKGLYYDLWKSPLAGVNLSEEMKDFSWPKIDDESRIKNIVRSAKELHEQNEYFITVGGCAMTVGFFQEFQWLQGIQNAYLNLAMDPDGSRELLEKLEELEIQFWTWILPIIGEYIDMMVIPDDFAGQTGLLISKSMFEEFFKPRYTRLFSTIKKLAPHIKTFYHCCGAVTQLIPDIIEMGADILNPLQLSADGMNIAQIKKDFGKDICFWGGGVDTQFTLPNGTKQEIKDEVKRNMDILAPGGGYIFNTVHNIQGDVPPENIATMFETFAENAKY